MEEKSPPLFRDKLLEGDTIDIIRQRFTRRTFIFDLFWFWAWEQSGLCGF